ncbi:MAG: hypothetical protein EKK41_23565 [Hyphomicrobiales bacterium]|nr:MAG: hypothetical protein EKK41_23565 [Hyphomicrobiales bacterium]
MDENADASEDGQTRFRLKMGGAELEFIGGADILKSTIMPVADRMISMVDTHASLQQAPAPRQIEAVSLPPDDVAEKRPSQDAAGLSGHSTNTIAASMKVSNAPELAMAACAHLALVKGKSTFTGKDILDEMKSATGFYMKNMHKNHGQTLVNLTKAKKLHQMSADLYALPNDAKIKLSAALAEIK